MVVRDVEEARTELEQPGRGIDAAERSGRRFADGGDAGQAVLDRGHHFGMAGFPLEPHRLGEVVGGDEHHIDVGHRGDPLAVLEGGRVLELDDQQGLVVVGLQEVGVAVRAATARDAPLAERRELCRLHQCAGLVGCVQLWNDDAVNPEGERAPDQRWLEPAEAHQRRHAPEVTGPGQISEPLPVGWAVLCLQPCTIEAQRSEEVDAVGGHRMTGDDGRHPARGKPMLGPIPTRAVLGQRFVSSLDDHGRQV